MNLYKFIVNLRKFLTSNFREDVTHVAPYAAKPLKPLCGPLHFDIILTFLSFLLRFSIDLRGPQESHALEKNVTVGLYCVPTGNYNSKVTLKNLLWPSCGPLMALLWPSTSK